MINRLSAPVHHPSRVVLTPYGVPNKVRIQPGEQSSVLLLLSRHNVKLEKGFAFFVATSHCSYIIGMVLSRKYNTQTRQVLSGGRMSPHPGVGCRFSDHKGRMGKSQKSGSTDDR